MKAAAINDMSGFGKCSLIADISVLTVMGIQACPVPTAILTAQTGFPSYYCEDMTRSIPHFTEEWDKKGERFDGILTGFLMNEGQADEVIRFVSRFHGDGTVLLVDPVMADHGKTYANFSEPLLRKMKLLAAEADILTPNISELCLLAGADMKEVLELSGDMLYQRLGKLAQEIIAQEIITQEIIEQGMSLHGADTEKANSPRNKDKKVIVTGIPIAQSQSRFSKGNGAGTPNEKSQKVMGNLVVDQAGAKLFKVRQAGGGFSGAGDLFAAVILGGVLKGKSVEASVELAEGFIYAAANAAYSQGIDRNEGTEYEPYLYMLADQADIFHNPVSAQASAG